MSSKSDENDQNYIVNLNPRKLGEMENSANKVLTERNASSSVLSGLFSSRVSDFDGDEKISPAADLSSRPYDPVTNYLSPRPKFLRYNPSRRREIFLRRQNDGAAEILVPRTPSSEEETDEVKIEDIESEFSEIDEEIEDEGERDEEDCGWTMKALLKFLIVIASFVLSTLYITSMNTPTPSFEVLRMFGSGFRPILNHTDEFDEFGGGSSLVMETLSAKESNLWDEEVTEEATSKMDSEGVSQFIHQEDARSIGFMEETEMSNGENKGKTEYGYMDKVEDTEQVEEVEGNEVEFIEQDDGNQENGLEEDESVQASKPSIINEYTRQNKVIAMEELGDWEMVETNKGEAKSLSRITIWERITNEISSFVEDLEKLKSELVELMHIETESVLKTVLGLSVSSAILTCLVLSSKFKKKKVGEKEPTVSASVMPSLLQSPVVEAEKIITREMPSPLPSPSTVKPTCVGDQSNYEHTGNVDSFKMMPSSIHSRDEVESFKELYHHEAPTVQLLGEIVVGSISNSLKNKSGLKNRMTEAEDSSFHVSVEQKPVSKNMNSGPEQALSEFSTTSSPSNASITTKKRTVKKEVRGDEEVKSIPTPVRRSTRIRNRIVSP